MKRSIAGERRMQYRSADPASPPIRWPEVVAAGASVASILLNFFLPSLQARPWLASALVAGAVGAIYLAVGQRLVAHMSQWKKQKARLLDDADAVLVKAASVIRAAALCRTITTRDHTGTSIDLGHILYFVHGPTSERLRGSFQESVSGLQRLVLVLLASRPPAQSDALETWARTLTSQVAALHEVVNSIVMLAPTLPPERRTQPEDLRLGCQAFDGYKDFWREFKKGSGAGVSWTYADALAPTGTTTIAPLQLPPLA